jgi:hypothetical protein
MNRQKTWAVGLLIGGMIFLTVSAGPAARHADLFHVAPVRFAAFLLLGPGVGVVLCGVGWAQLCKVKLACPKESWPRFLREDVIPAVVVLVVVVVGVLMGPSLRPFLDDAWAALHDFETVVHVVR